MANELTFSAALTFFKSSVMGAPVGRSVNGLQQTVTGSRYVENILSVSITEVLVPVGGVVNLGYAVFHNTDDTNFVKLRPGSGLTDLIKIRRGGWAFVPLVDDAVLYAIADTAACLLEYLIVSA